MAVKKKILFVDAQTHVLEGLKRALHGMRREWDFFFAPSGKDALRIMAREGCDVVVSEQCMPDMKGLDLLQEVMAVYPRSVRIILSGHSDEELMNRSFYPAHQYLAKPCDSEKLKTVLLRACALRELLADEQLRILLSNIKTLPSMPALYSELLREVNKENASIPKIGEIISKDVGMTAKILQLVNSALYGFRASVTSPFRAVRLLGLNTIGSLVLSCQVFSSFEKAGGGKFYFERIWGHSLRVAMTARKIAAREKNPLVTLDDCFMVGLLHDSGKLLLAANLAESNARAIALSRHREIPLHEAERLVFGTTHAEVGAYLMGLWGFPDPIVEAIAYHHFPARCLYRGFAPLSVVHAADLIARETSRTNASEIRAGLDEDYLSSVGCLEKFPIWVENCRSGAMAEGPSV